MKMKKLLLVISIISLSLNSCTTPADQQEQVNADSSTFALSDQLMMSTLWYQLSGEMRALYYQSYELAKYRLTTNITKSDKKPAVVLDIDETVLDNSPYEARLILSDQSYASESWKQWCEEGIAKTLPGAKDFLFYADSIGVEVFYISNRRENVLASTLENLIAEGLPNADSAHVLLRTDARDKSVRRDKVSENYEIILFIGDNLTDFSAIFEDRSDNFGLSTVEAHRAKFGHRFIVLPNPMYGDWEGEIYKGDFSISNQEKNELRRNALKN